MSVTNAELVSRIDAALEAARNTPVTYDHSSLVDIYAPVVKTLAENWPAIKAALEGTSGILCGADCALANGPCGRPNCPWGPLEGLR